MIEQILDEKGIELFESLKTIAKLLNYNVVYGQQKDIEIRSKHSIQIFLYDAGDNLMTVYVYDNNFNRLKSYDAIRYEAKRKVLKELIEMMEWGLKWKTYLIKKGYKY